MKNILSAASDAFKNPDSPWYYVVGVVCLILVFAALAVYIVISGKRKKAKEKAERENTAAQSADESENSEKDSNTAIAETEETPDNAEKTSENQENNASDAAEDKNSTAVEEKPAEQTATETEQPPIVNDETDTAEKADTENTVTATEKAEEPPEEKPAEPEQKPKQKPKTAAKPKQSEETKATAETKPKTSGAKPKKTAKPFIDRLIAAKDLHGVYNELKNTVLSYPGIKAKITKEEETFLFGTEKKAAIALVDDNVELRLYIDAATAPKQFGAEKSDDAELPTRLIVNQSNIDSAQKLIIYAMNVALLTRNDRHRHVDYVKNAINAKAKAKKK